MDSNFLAKRIHSLTGVVPVGVFLVYHLYSQLYLHGGATLYNERVEGVFPVAWMEWVFLIAIVYIPLLFHSIYGVRLCFEMKVQTEYATYFSHVLYWLQRLSGIGVFLFLGAHLFKAKIAPLLEGSNAHWEHLNEGFSDPQYGFVTITVYVLGILGATFHLANGLNTFCMTWGIATTPAGQKRVRAFSFALFIILATMGLYAITAVV